MKRLQVVIQTGCYGLNVCASPNSYTETLTSLWWYLEERLWVVTSVRLGAEGRILVIGWVFLQEEEEAPELSFSAMWGHREKAAIGKLERGSSDQNPIVIAFDLWLPVSRMWENIFLLLSLLICGVYYSISRRPTCKSEITDMEPRNLSAGKEDPIL